MTHTYVAIYTRVLNIESLFYKEALKSVTTFVRKKGMAQVKAWDEENIFYNPLITSKSGKTVTETEYFRKKGIYKLGQLLEEKSKEARNLPFDRRLTALINNITLDTTVRKEDMVLLGNGNEVKMSMITQKDLYEDAILKMSTDHIHQSKWVVTLNALILWEEV